MNDYWEEAINIASEECGIQLSKEQTKVFADSVKSAHDNYGMAFYSPPPTERLDAIKKESEEKYARLEKEFREYRSSAENAVKRVGNMHRDTTVSISNNGEVSIRR